MIKERKEDIDIPSDFKFIRVSIPPSRHILLCFSGFTSEEDDKFTKFQPFVDKFESCEIYSL